MNNLIKLSKKHTIIFCILLAVGAVGLNNSFAFGIFNLKPPLPTNNAFLYIASQLIAIIFVFAIALLTGKLGQVGFSGKNFLKGVKLGWPFMLGGLVTFTTTFLGSYVGMKKEVHMPALWEIIAFTVIMFLVGVLEEVLHRGIILNSLLDKWKDKSNGIMLSAIVSSVIFGAVHIVTWIIQPNMPIYTLTQMIMATMGGILFSAIYIRSKNIWANIWAHTFIDWFTMIFTMFFPQAADAASYDITFGGALNYIMVNVPFLLIGLFYLRKSKIRDAG